MSQRSKLSLEEKVKIIHKYMKGRASIKRAALHEVTRGRTVLRFCLL